MTTCVLTGVAAEYSLAPLARHLRGNGVDCVEVDMALEPLEAACPNAGRDVVLVTSCHPFVDGAAYREVLGFDVPVSAVPEQLGYLRPRRCCFVPHDLTEPLKDDELPFVPLFDALLMPGPEWWWLAAYTEVHACGWIKAAHAPGERQGGALFLPSEIAHYATLGPAAFLERFAPVLGHRPSIKLPVFAGSGPFERALRGAGHRVLDASLGTGELIAGADVVISNGLSSVLSEAALAGVPTLCLADGVTPVEAQRAAMARYASARVLSIAEASEALERGALPARVQGRVKPFDFELASRVILGS